MPAEGYFWSADRGFGHETQAPARRRGGDGRVRDGAGGDGDVGAGGDYHVLQLLRASLSLTHSLFLSLFLSVSPCRPRVPNKSAAARRDPGYNPGATSASLGDITSPPGQSKRRKGADSRGNSNSGMSCGESAVPTAGMEGESAYWWRPPAALRAGACSQIGSVVICLSGRFLI